jgi:hypothetical protein
VKTRTIVLIVVACIAGFVVLVGGIIAFVFQATSGVAETGDRFFQAAREGDYVMAYSLTSEEIQRRNSVADLEAFIGANGFGRAVDTSWSSRSINNNTGSLAGTLTTATGGTIPVEIGLVYESGEWKIDSISRSRAGLVDALSGPRPCAPDIGKDVPPDANPEHLLFLNAGGFLHSMENGDFDFWRLRWAEGTTDAELAARYPRTEALAGRLAAFEDVRPSIKSARMTSAGDLAIQGVSEGQGETLAMTLTLKREKERWKLTDFAYELE